MVIPNSGILKNNEVWSYNGRKLEFETVNEFNYLGMLMTFNGKFRQTQKKIAEQGRKAVFAMLNVCKENYFNIETHLSACGTFVSVINASEVCGFHQAPER